MKIPSPHHEPSSGQWLNVFLKGSSRLACSLRGWWRYIRGTYRVADKRALWCVQENRFSFAKCQALLTLTEVCSCFLILIYAPYRAYLPLYIHVRSSVHDIYPN